MPVPACCPVLVCSKCRKSFVCSSAEMPGPLSSTSTRRQGPASAQRSARTRKPTPPRSVNFTALPSTLMNTWRSLLMSATMYRGTSPISSRTNVSLFASVRTRNIISKSLRRSGRSNVVRFRVVRPASILDISRMSLIRASRCSPLRLIVSRYWPCRASRFRSRSMSCEKPRMAFIGVRISCDMFARKALLARLAASAASFALATSSSTRRRWVTSSIARTSSSPCWPAWSLRALSSITRRPITGKVCSSSKSSNTELFGTMSSSSVRRSGMSHWPLPSS